MGRYAGRLVGGSFLVRDGLLLVHGGNDGDHEVLASLKVSSDLLTNLGVGDLDVVLGTTVRVHQVEETVLDVKELEFLPPNVGDVHVVGGGRNVFKLLAGEDVDGDKVDLGVTVLTSLGSGHVNDLARPALDNNVTVLPESGTLHREGLGSPGTGGLESLVVLLLSHFECINLELKSKRVGEVRFLKLEEARGVTPIQERPIFDLFRKQGIGVSAFWKCGEWDHSHYTCWA